MGHRAGDLDTGTPAKHLVRPVRRSTHAGLIVEMEEVDDSDRPVAAAIHGYGGDGRDRTAAPSDKTTIVSSAALGGVRNAAGIVVVVLAWRSAAAQRYCQPVPRGRQGAGRGGRRARGRWAQPGGRRSGTARRRRFAGRRPAESDGPVEPRTWRPPRRARAFLGCNATAVAKRFYNCIKMGRESPSVYARIPGPPRPPRPTRWRRSLTRLFRLNGRYL